MSQPAFSRRVLLSAAAAAGAAISLPFGAESKESTNMDKKDMEGIRHYEFGNVTVTSISDGTRAQDPGLSLASKERIEELFVRAARLRIRSSITSTSSISRAAAVRL